MRLFYKLILLAVLPVMITVGIITAINRVLTDSTLRVGMERAALEHFGSKSTLMRTHFQKNKDILRTLAAQKEFVRGDMAARFRLMGEWAQYFPDGAHQLYFWDGGHFYAGGDGAIVDWDAKALRLHKMENSLVTGQVAEPETAALLVLTWVWVDGGALGVAHPVADLRRLMESIQTEGVAFMLLMDSSYNHHIFGNKAARFLENPNHEALLQELKHRVGENTLAMFTLPLLEREQHVVTGVVSNTDWKIALIFDESSFFEGVDVINSLNLLVLGLAVALVLLIAFLMNLTMIRPLGVLMEAQQKIGQGDLDVRVEGLPRDEIGQLGDSLNIMTTNLRALSAELAASEQRFRLLAENIPGVVYLCNNDTEYSTLYLNDAMETLSGYPKAAFFDGTITVAKLFHPDDHDRIFHEVDACLERREPFHLQYRIIHRTGAVRWVEEVGTGVWEGDRLLFLEGFISDATERMKAEEALRLSETRYRALFEGANHSIMILAPDTTVLMINRDGAEVFRRHVEECVGKTLGGLLPEFEPIVKERMARVVTTGEMQTFEDVVHRPEGAQWYLSFHQHVPLPDEPGAVLIMSYDITERKRAEDALRYRLEFENLLSEMSTNFINIDHNSIDQGVVDALASLAQFIGCDGAYVFLFGEEGEGAHLTHSWNNGKLEGLNVLLRNEPIRLMPGWQRNILRNEMNLMNHVEGMRVRDLAGGYISEAIDIHSFCEVPLIYRDKVLGVLGLCNRDAGHNWTTDEGALLKFAGHVITNALQRKEAEESLAKYRDELERLVQERTEALEAAQAELVSRERLATLGQLTATVSHELRNPLGTIRGSFFTIAERSRGKGLNIERALERVERNIIRCDTIIEELLDFTRSRNLALSFGDPDSVVLDLVEDYPVPRNLTLEVDLGVGVRVQFDPEKFRRCVINILNNACEAMREIPNSTVCRPGSSVRLYSRVEEGKYQLSIEDNGPGVSPEVLEKIYEPLFSTKGFGVGLGLTLVRQIMEQHGGGITIKSTLEKGTQILLEIPLTPTATAQAT